MTNEQFKKANQVFKEIDNLKARLYALNDKNIKLDSLSLESNSYLGRYFIIADGFVLDETGELIRELLLQKTKARIESLQKQFDQL